MTQKGGPARLAPIAGVCADAVNTTSKGLKTAGF